MHHQEQFFEIILNLVNGSGEFLVYKVLSGALAVLLFGAVDLLCNFERGHHGEYSYEVIWNLDQWFKMRCR